jgi:hypothetical protein
VHPANHEMPHGMGTLLSPRGAMYEGQFDHGVMHGQGKFVWPSGEEYVGAVMLDRPHGHGAYRWPDGATYHGEFFEGQQHGHGVYTSPDKSVYDGQWFQNRRQGRGTLTSVVSGSVYDGMWDSDVQSGRGVFLFSSGNKYEGQVEQDQPEGQVWVDLVSRGELGWSGMWDVQTRVSGQCIPLNHVFVVIGQEKKQEETHVEYVNRRVCVCV